MTRSALSRKIAIGAASSVAAAVLAVGAATAAHATTAPLDQRTTTAAKTYHSAGAIPKSDIMDCALSDPHQTDLCWWVGANQTGKMHPVRDAIRSWTTQKEPSCPSKTWNDCASTLYNDNATSGALVFSDAVWNGGVACVLPGTYVADLGNEVYPNTGAIMDNSISSNSWADPSLCGG